MRAVTLAVLLTTVVGCSSSDPAVPAPAVSAATFTVGGSVVSLGSSTSGLVLQNNGGDDIRLTADGTFVFSTALANGSAYGVTVKTQPNTTPPQTCRVTRGNSGTIAGANVTNAKVECFTSVYTIGGPVRGLLGTLVLQNNGAEDTTVAAPATTFKLPAEHFEGDTYNITVKTQPASPPQTCLVTNPSGTIHGVSIGSVVVDCSPTACVAPIGAGTRHGSISAPETWTEADSPHIVPFDISLSAAVTVESCAVVRMAAHSTVIVNPNGAFIAAGEAGRPVTVEALVPGSAWASIRSAGGDLSLTHAVVHGGGDPLNAGVYSGALRMHNTGTTGTLHVDDVEITDSQGQGVYISAGLGFDATSQNLRIHGSGGVPIHVYPPVIGSIPTGDYTGNVRDVISITAGTSAVLDNQTMHNRGVPYHVGSFGLGNGGRMDINSGTDSSVAVLTIEPGVTIQFAPDGALNVIGSVTANGPARGALIANGTLLQPIIFTTDQSGPPLAGDWLGIWIDDPVDSRTRIQNVQVKFAGGASGGGSNSCPYPNTNGINSAAIRIVGPPLTQFITDSEIISSASFGIDRGWRSDLQTDFLPTNRFTAVASCKQTTPRTENGVCPQDPPCP